MSTPTRSAEPEHWFTELCAKHELVPDGPRLARDIRAGDVLFDALGGPKPVKSVQINKRSVTIRFDGSGVPSDNWPLDVSFTLIARRKS